MSKILPEQDFSFLDFTRKCVKYVNFKIVTKQRNLSANTMFTTFTYPVWVNYISLGKVTLAGCGIIWVNPKIRQFCRNFEFDVIDALLGKIWK